MEAVTDAEAGEEQWLLGFSFLALTACFLIAPKVTLGATRQ